MSDFYLTTDIEKYRDTLESICKESSDYLMKVEGRTALSAFADVYEIIPDLPKNFPVKCFAFIYKDEVVGYRIAFSVTDWHESKAILDRTGAQKLLGNGDMLLSQGFNSAPLHIQAPIVELDEIKSVVSYIKKANGTADYINSFNKNRAPIENNRLYIIELLESISQVNSVDIFFIQQKMDSTYREAVEAIDFLEKNKAISRFSGSKGRTVDHNIVNKLINKFRFEYV